jgi:NAD(P)-dependent dehydrogenase (short-subunit alcohol dehydrogenase family)
MTNAVEGRARRWFVTGASSGIGHAIVSRALSDGDVVTAVARNTRALSALRDRFPLTLEVRTLDVRDRAAINRVVAAVLRYGPVDIVVNNAGFGAVGAAEELTDAQIDDQLLTMLHGPIAITRAFLPAFRENGGGKIIQLSGVGGQTAHAGASAYNAAKWGLEGFTESVANEVADFGIGITLIEPGAICAGFGRALHRASPLEAYRAGPVAAFRLLASGLFEVYTGDPARIASIIVDVARMPCPPLRLALGCDAYDAIDTALRRRLDALALHRELSCSVCHMKCAVSD